VLLVHFPAVVVVLVMVVEGPVMAAAVMVA
jgi:hypothetical protein